MPRFALCAAVLLALLLGGCSLKADDGKPDGGDGGGFSFGAPVAGPKADDEKATEKLGFPVIATRNTTRVAGRDPVVDAAGVATALFPSTEETSRPLAAVIADKDDWQGIVAAGVLSGSPVRAPILLSDGEKLPAVTTATLSRLDPKGITVPAKTQAILVGDKPPPPDKLKSTVIKGGDPYELAAEIDRFSSVARGKASPDVVVASGERPDFAMPAGAYAARSGSSVLFTKRDELPPATVKALKAHEKPRIFLLGPAEVISPQVEGELRKLGKVTRVGAENPVDNAIEFARFEKGWRAFVPGQNLTIASAQRPADAAAAAGLGANGVFAPLLLTDRPQPLPRSLEGYLLDIQPGYEGEDPSQGVYNHVWILGGADAVSPQAQDRIDSATALVPVDEPKQ